MIGAPEITEKPQDEAGSDPNQKNLPPDPEKKEVDESLYKYENDKCIYMDPSSGVEFEWVEDKKEWKRRDDVGIPDGPSKPHGHDYEFDGETYVYTEKESGTKYKWDQTKNEWITSTKDELKNNSDEEEFDEGERPEFKRQDMSQGVYGFDGESHTYTDSKDGTVYVWDKDKNAWFPKIDDDFLAQYQMSYGFNSSSQPPADVALETQKEIPEPNDKNEAEKDVETKKQKKDPTWFEVDERSNTKVYVSNLPTDFNENEFVDLMQKCGLVMKDPDSGKMKVKLYVDSGTNIFKGDALCTYIKVESVDLALRILDGYDVKGKKIKVERAKFTMKGDTYDPSLKPKKRRKKDIQKIKKMQEKLFDWRPEKMRGEREKHERVVIVKNLFEPSIFEKDVGLILEYQQDLREECTKCGNVKKVTVFDRHPDGVAQIIFKEAEAADACIQLLNNRWFGKRQITASAWDGKTKYKVEETEEQKNERLKKWEKFIEEEQSKESIPSGSKYKDSDQETRSSAGSDDSTDEEVDNKNKKSKSTNDAALPNS